MTAEGKEYHDALHPDDDPCTYGMTGVCEIGEAIAAIEQAARAEAAAEIAALKVSVTGLRATAAEQVVTAINAESDSVPFYEGQVYAYDEMLRRIDEALAAPPAEGTE